MRKYMQSTSHVELKIHIYRHIVNLTQNKKKTLKEYQIYIFYFICIHTHIPTIYVYFCLYMLDIYIHIFSISMRFVEIQETFYFQTDTVIQGHHLLGPSIRSYQKYTKKV